MTPLERHLIDRVRQLERQVSKLMRHTQPLGWSELDEWIDSRRRADIELHEIELPPTGQETPL